MTSSPAAPIQPAARPVRGRSGLRAWVHPTGLLALLLAAPVAFVLWAAANRPARPPDFQGPIGGLVFSPFQRGQDPEPGAWPSAEQIRADLGRAAALTGRIRTESVRGPLAEVPALAAGLPLRITLGARIDGRSYHDAAELGRLIAIAHANRNVERVLVGNETLLRGALAPEQLVAAIGLVRASIGVPVSTSEPWQVWLKNPALARAVDFIAIPLLPHGEGIAVDDAVPFVLDKIEQVAAAYPGKPVVVGAVGWPSVGADIGAAHASRINQAAFLRAFLVAARQRGLDYFVTEAFDQPWRAGLGSRAGGSWGVLDSERRAKWPLTGPVRETPDWPLWAVLSIAAASLLAGALMARRPDMRLVGKLTVAALAQFAVATLAGALIATSGPYLGPLAALAWGGSAASQALLVPLLLVSGFTLAETLWAGRPRNCPRLLPASSDAALPKVSIHVPICNEPPERVRRTLDALARLHYPAFEVLVADHNTTDPALWEPVAEHCARLGARFRFFHLGVWPGHKAGALNFALNRTVSDAEVIALLDAGTLVAPDWLRCAASLFERPDLGMLESPQHCRDEGGSWLMRPMRWVRHGTMPLFRKRAVLAVGGWAEWCFGAEAAEVAVRLRRAGWRALYVPQSFGGGIMPDDFAALRRERFRLACGATRILRRHWTALLDPFGSRFVSVWLWWLEDALGLAFMLAALVWSAGLIWAPQGAEFPTPLFLLPSLGLIASKLLRVFAMHSRRNLAGRAGMVIAMLALSHATATGVWRGLAAVRPIPGTPAQAQPHGLAAVRQELLLVLAAWTAALAVGATHGLASGQARLWCAVLLFQSAPYVAAVVTAAAALPGRMPDRTHRQTAGMPAPDLSAAGD